MSNGYQFHTGGTYADTYTQSELDRIKKGLEFDNKPPPTPSTAPMENVLGIGKAVVDVSNKFSKYADSRIRKSNILGDAVRPEYMFKNPETNLMEKMFVPTPSEGLVRDMVRPVGSRYEVNPNFDPATMGSPQDYIIIQGGTPELAQSALNPLNNRGVEGKFRPFQNVGSSDVGLFGKPEGFMSKFNTGEGRFVPSKWVDKFATRKDPSTWANKIAGGDPKWLQGKGLLGKEGGFLSKGTGFTNKMPGMFSGGQGRIGQVMKGIGQIGKGGIKGLFGGLGAGGAGGAGALAMGPAGWAMLALGLLGGKLFKKKTFLGKLFSDKKLKKNIKYVGKSKSGVPIVEFEYKDMMNIKGRYRGVLSQDVPWAAEKHPQYGYEMVDYSKIDVPIKRIG